MAVPRVLTIRRAPSAALFAFYGLVILVLIAYQAPSTPPHLPITSRLVSRSEPLEPTSNIRARSNHSPSNRIQHKLQPIEVDDLRIASVNKDNLISKMNNAAGTTGAKKNLTSNTSRNSTIKKYTETTTTVQPLPPGAVLTRDLYVAGHSRPHPELCPALGARLRLVILVSSAPAHAAAREAVRLTWGHAAQRADVALGFVLGASPPQLRAALDREDALYGDLIEGRSVDSYSNLTLKTLSMLEWVDTYCPRAPRLLKTDDDMFINVNRLLQFAEAPGRRNATNTVWGKLWHGARVIRDLRSKYFVPLSQLTRMLFPDYLNGPAYLLTSDAVKKIFAVSATEPFLRLEDVFITGVLANKVGVRRENAPTFFHYKKVSRLHPCEVHLTIAIHRVDYHKQFDLWRTLLSNSISRDCTSYAITSSFTSQRAKHQLPKLATTRQSQ